jgi:hypothetical protein
MKKALFIIAVIVVLVSILLGRSRPDGFPVLKGPYLGQQAPGMVPALFAPLPLRANETWFWHGSPSFSADGGELYFVRYIKGQNSAEMMRLLREKDDWRAPERASFSSPQHRDNNPFFAGDGSLYFYSARFGGSICRVDARDTWSPPEPVFAALAERSWKKPLRAKGSFTPNYGLPMIPIPTCTLEAG